MKRKWTLEPNRFKFVPLICKSNKGENVRINVEDKNTLKCLWPQDLSFQCEPSFCNATLERG